jgi:hypothetical protein
MTSSAADTRVRSPWRGALVASLIVAGLAWRWIPIIGLAVAAFVSAGFLAAGAGDRLVTASDLGPFLGHLAAGHRPGRRVGDRSGARVVAARRRNR